MSDAANSASVVASVHVSAAAETAGEKEDLGVAPRRDEQRPKIVDADENTGAVW